MQGLMLHCGAQLSSRDQVFAVAPPAATTSYVPLPYESFVTRIEKQLAVEGITIKEERLALAKEGQRLFGLMHLELPTIKNEAYGCVLGLRNSYDKSFSTGLCTGATVFVCDNLSFRGSGVTFQRKHTANLLRDLSWIITETVNQLPLQFAEQSNILENYRRTVLTDAEAHDLIISFFDHGAVTSMEIPFVLKEWREPRHLQFAECGKTMWRLFNAATETLKGDLWRLPRRTQAIHDVLEEKCAQKETFLQSLVE